MSEPFRPWALALAACAALGAAAASAAPRARDLGIPFPGTPGPLNAITDVAGVEVGYTTLVAGEGRLEVGKGPVRTGVTAILPRGRKDPGAVFGGYAVGNGNGEMTGTIWVEDSGVVGSPVLITNTHSVGVVRDAVIAWMIRNGGTGQDWGLPVVAETWDGHLNDINGFHVKPEHVFAALDGASGGPIAEGNVGGGTGMHTFEFKGGTGTASRRVRTRGVGDYTVGVLVQSNFGRRAQLQVAGLPVGREWPEDAPFTAEAGRANELGSIIVVVATDAPLYPTQLKRVAQRAAMGVARTGGTAGNGSGDIFLAFSTANAAAAGAGTGLQRLEFLPNDQLDAVFEAAVHATEEAIINAMVAARTMTGIDGRRLVAIDHARLQSILKRHGRLQGPPWAFEPTMLFPADRSLSRPEDAVVLPDGRLLVADQLHGLRLVDAAGGHRPYGNFAAAGYAHRPPQSPGGANGVTLEPDGRHVLVTDMFQGRIYRVDTATERTELFHQHAFGVNMARRDRRGGLWFTQSTRNGPTEGEAGLWRAVARPVADGAVYYVAPGRNGRPGAAVAVASGLSFANGIALDEQAGSAYVAETMGHRVLRYQLDVAKGTLRNPVPVLAAPAPDNLELDDAGQLWVALPLRMEVVTVDLASGESRSAFRIATPASEALIAEAMQRMQDGRSVLEIFGPGFWEPGPGFITGMALSPGNGPLYLTGLGNALIRVPR